MGIGLLRVLLALSVVIEHSSKNTGFNFASGVVAVEMFYMISGFYMAMILKNKYHKYRSFITNRFLKIYPIYYVILFATIFFGLAMYLIKGNWETLQYYATFVSHLHPFTLLTLLLTNILIFGQDVVMFLGVDMRSGLLYFTDNFRTSNPGVWNFLLVPQAWTLAIELMFYLIAPFLVKLKTSSIVSMMMLSGSFRLLLIRFGLKNDPWNYRFFPTELVFFLAGILAFRIYWKIRHNASVTFRSYTRNISIGVCLLIIGFHSLPIPELYKLWGYYLIFWLALPYMFSYSKNLILDRKLGELSYPIYISHVLVISVLSLHAIQTRLSSTPVFVLATIIFTLILSALLVKYIQEPIEKYRQKHVK